ncbi:LOW QUALITY PROTEIN: hypothetical protein Cgig2_018473 [Carnegiea gigantea]|uniref:Uncharacterized protein n=1 Tax=Carnegiea gigantea TaxID=171969 RepID=A0A9Q1GTQ0_9CARY|nr:LOW QUALITY PROTEIN: hypothetical protein Cgig2_011175 [Carnegiea gigantea]KAJ8425384.1 LOW QUALITY PROTEIN: hypothetical protein Cgig2_018473 [Carnegiea gigantea]
MAVEMHAGLASEGGSKLKMLLTYVDKLPNGSHNHSGKKEARPVLGDITNQLGKRGSNLISSSPKSSSKSVIGSKRSADPNNSDDDDSHFRKHVYKVVESLEKERYGTPKCLKIINESGGLSPLSGGKTYRLRAPSNHGSPVQAKAQSGVLNPAHDAKEPPSGSGCRTLPNVVALGDTIKESIPSVTVAESSKVSQRNDLEGVKDCEETVVVSDSGENDCTQESLATKVVTNETKTLDVGYLPSSQSESVVNSRLVELQDKGPYGLDRCKLLKGDISSSSAVGFDLLKSCSCSFCTKVLGKSQKEANNLAQRYSGENEKLRHGQQHSKKGLENDLTSQWNSLFQHMGETFVSESSQLQSYLLTLKDLREGFRNSGSICGSSDGQQCSFEGFNP